ncbi:MAG: DUF1013 domain-containing protein [Rickettsiales bacterium]|jgi:hypothetical protein|nr:DUF1013 domain-containing protein [Rickettsiales bacterium]
MELFMAGAGKILMHKETAGWLIDNTSLTFAQIADFCGMHPLEVQALADRETAEYAIGFNPIINGMLSKEDIARCEADSEARLSMNQSLEEFVKKSRAVKGRYTPMAHRQNRPDAIMWLVKNHPELSDMQVCKLARTTKATVQAIRDRTHKLISEIQPRNPVLLEICSEYDLQAAIELANKRLAAAEKRMLAAEKKAARKKP